MGAIEKHIPVATKFSPLPTSPMAVGRSSDFPWLTTRCWITLYVRHPTRGANKHHSFVSNPRAIALLVYKQLLGTVAIAARWFVIFWLPVRDLLDHIYTQFTGGFTTVQTFRNDAISRSKGEWCEISLATPSSILEFGFSLGLYPKSLHCLPVGSSSLTYAGHFLQTNFSRATASPDADGWLLNMSWPFAAT